MYNFSCNITIIDKQKKNEHTSSGNYKDSTHIQPAAVTEEVHLQIPNSKVDKTKRENKHSTKGQRLITQYIDGISIDDIDGSKNVHKKKKHLKHSEDQAKAENLNNSFEKVCFNENGKTDFSESKKHKKRRKHSPEHEFSPKDSCRNETFLHYNTNMEELPKTEVSESKKHKKKLKHPPEHEFSPRDSRGKETSVHYDAGTEEVPKIDVSKSKKHKKKLKHSFEHEFPSRDSCDNETSSHHDTNTEDLPKIDVNESKKHKKRQKHLPEHEFSPRDSRENETSAHYDAGTEEVPKTDVHVSKKYKKRRKHSPEHEFLPRDSRGNETSAHYHTGTEELPKTDVNESKKHKKRQNHAPDHEFLSKDSRGNETSAHYDTGTEELPKTDVNEPNKHKKKLKHPPEHEDLPKTDVNEFKKHKKRKKHSPEHEFPSRDSYGNETSSHYDTNVEDLPKTDVNESKKHKKRKKHSPEHEFLSRDCYRNEISSHDAEQESLSLQNFTKKKKKRHLGITPDAVDIQNSHPNENVNSEHINKKRDKKRKNSGSTHGTEDLPNILSPHEIKEYWESLTKYDPAQDGLSLQNFTKKKKKHHLEITPDSVDIQNFHPNENVNSEPVMRKDSGSTNGTEDLPKTLSPHEIKEEREAFIQDSLSLQNFAEKKKDAVDIHPNENVNSEPIITRKDSGSTNGTEDLATHEIKNEWEALGKYDQVQDDLSLQNFTKTKKKRHVEITPEAVQNSDPNESVNSEDLIKDSNKKGKDSRSTNLPKILLPHEMKEEIISDDASRKKQHNIKLEALTNFDEVQDYLDLQCVRQRLSEDHTRMLKQLRISLPWPVPPTHLIETRMSSHPTKDQKKRFEEFETPMNTSHYSPVEDKIITENWKYFCKVHNIPTDPEPFLSFEPNSDTKIKGSALPKLERIKFVRFLGHKLEHRYLFSIYRRFKKLFCQINKGRFSEAENKIILEYVQKSHDSNPFASLAHVLNRDRHTILMRYKTLGRI
ncbi:hypothetical protein RI129_009086 [Pyrocoelia pectoralis]|uniref:Uncharacterized protein n=1 Tax=Pyrocoelia pectoralis TaxID=417401 RepID=A0AAN7VGD1_9COLE